MKEESEEKSSEVVKPKEKIALEPEDVTLEPEDGAAYLTRGLWTEVREHGVSSSWRCLR